MTLASVQRTIESQVRLDAATGRPVHAAANLHPTLFGTRVTDASAALGAGLWIALVAASAADALALSEIELFVALVLLVAVPLGLGLAATPRQSGGTHPLYAVAVAGQLPAALAAVGTLALPIGAPLAVVLGLPWLGVAGAVALFGVWRLLSRGPDPVPELAVDAALLYLPVGAVALVLHRAGIDLGFQPIIVLLTAVHYHFAGFVLPLVAGRAGRILANDDGRFGRDAAGRLATAATLVIVVNLALIAVGITFSPLVEVVAVAFFTVAVTAFALLTLLRVVPALSSVPAVLLGVACLAIVGTMALALAYGYSAFPATGRLITIGEMVRWHGTLNAFGFAIPALVAFRLVDARRARTE